MTATAKRPTAKHRSEALHLGVILRQRRGEDIREEETVRAGVRRLRVVPPIEMMWTRRNSQGEPLITARQYDAACRLRDDYETGILGARESQELPPGVDKGGCAELVTQAQIEAGRRYEAAMQRCGIRLSPVVSAVVLGGYPANEVARAHRQDVRAIMGVLRAALDTVGDAYGMP